MENTINNTNIVNEQEIQWQINNANRVNATASNSTFSVGSTINSGVFTIGNASTDRRIINVVFKDTTVVVTYRERVTYPISYTSNYSYTQPDRVWKEVWGLKDGKMTLLEVINGKHTPAFQVAESIEFDDEK